uniref:glutamate receptor 1.2-like n=1 Tax=Erigeron canadensis TaxID=72917 RepID=UPI001CB8C0EB|nr:glutamate receptor 1.2-like [Erigeron canadensis]
MDITKRKGKILLLFFMLIMLWFQMPSQAQDDLPYKEIPVGVILEMESMIGKSVHSSISMAVSDFYMANSHYKTRIVIHNRDSHGESLHAVSAALDLLNKSKVQAIIGSESTADTKFLSVLADEARIPILSLSPAPSSNKYRYFQQITQDETIQFKAIAAMAELFKWKNVILICENTEDGRDMARFMTNAFQVKSISITYMSLIEISASSDLVHKELQKLLTMQTKVYVTHVSPSLASNFFLNAKRLGMMDAGFKWIITSKTMNFLSFMDGETIDSIQGAVGFKSYIPQSRNLDRFILQWRKEYHAKEINIYAIRAYDAVFMLAMAVERTHYLINEKTLETTDSAQWGTELLNQMLRISFDGLGGTFKLMNGVVAVEGIEIINVWGKEERKVGFWTSNAAFTKMIDKLNSFTDDGLKGIVWPGGMATKPERRMLQVGSRLRIGIPVKSRIGRLFEVSSDAQHGTMVTGFCADVFMASLNSLNRSLPFEFIPFKSNAEVGTVNYNDLLDLVHDGVFDAAIGDITITANRSNYVDFTVPYTEPGLAIVYKNADASMWIFMEPLGSDLWFASAGFFVLLGFVIWVLEHRTNEEFQGSPLQQIGTTFWFAFSTMVYAHRQTLQSNLSRFVVTVWLFVVLVLVSSYTATLSSLLTVEQFELASQRGSIGYQYGSPVRRLIIENLNFRDTRLKPYSTLWEFADALTRGSKKDGVDAIVDEIPYIKEFLANYPDGYSMVLSDQITNGFGFAFPQGSPLAPEISKQIVKLREDGSLKALENMWLKQGSPPVQKVLNFKGLRGLFLISGLSMAAALFLFMLYYIYEKGSFPYAMLAGGKLASIMMLINAKTANPE